MVCEEIVEGTLVEEVAVRLYPERGVLSVALVEPGECVKQQRRPCQHLAAGENDALDADVVRVGKVCDAAVDLVR